MLYLKEKFNVFFRERIVYWSIILSLSLNFYLWYLIYNFVDFFKEFHVLHYNIYFGIDLIGSPQKLLNIPLWGILILIFNLLIAYIIYIIKKSFIIPYFLLIASFFIHLELILYLLGVISMEY